MADTTDLENAIRARCLEIVTQASEQVLAVTMDACPLGDDATAGQLRDSHAVDPPVDAGTVFSVDIHADAPHAIFVAEGTRAHEIRPNRAKALRFEVGGSVVFATVVHHPGTTANTGWWGPDVLQSRWTDALDGVVS